MEVIPNPKDDGVIIKMSQEDLLTLFSGLTGAEVTSKFLIRLLEAIEEYYRSFPEV